LLPPGGSAFEVERRQAVHGTPPRTLVGTPVRGGAAPTSATHLTDSCSSPGAETPGGCGPTARRASREAGASSAGEAHPPQPSAGPHATAPAATPSQDGGAGPGALACGRERLCGGPQSAREADTPLHIQGTGAPQVAGLGWLPVGPTHDMPLGAAAPAPHGAGSAGSNLDKQVATPAHPSPGLSRPGNSAQLSPPSGTAVVGPLVGPGQEAATGATAQVDCAAAYGRVEDIPMWEGHMDRPGAGALRQCPEATPGAGNAGPGGGRTIDDHPSLGGGLDPDRAFLVPHTAKSAGSQANAFTPSASETQYPQSGGEGSSDAAHAGDRRSACSTGSMLPNFPGSADPIGLTLRKGPLDEGVAPLATATGIPTPTGATAMVNQHPPTIAAGIPGTQLFPRLPGVVEQMSAPSPTEILGTTGAFMQYSCQGVGGGPGNPTMMRGSHALSGPAPNRETNNKRVPDGDAGLGGVDDDMTDREITKDR